MTRIAIIGAGTLARVRANALLETGEAEIVGVASRHRDSARAFAGELGVTAAFDDYRRLAEVNPEAVLIEVPHAAQHAPTMWALEAGLPVLIGGSLAGSTAEGEAIRHLAARNGLVVEAGYQARYQDLFETVRGMIAGGELGEIVAVRSVALWDGDPASWYYRQHDSGGMPLTHMTYCFLNPVRWLLDADPCSVLAFANRKKHAAAGLIAEETCIANLLFPGDVLYSQTAGFVAPAGMPGWSISVIGTQAGVEMAPADREPGGMTVFRDGHARSYAFAHNGYVAQARAFLDALGGENRCRNTPALTLPDLRAADAMVASAREQRTIMIEKG